MDLTAVVLVLNQCDSLLGGSSKHVLHGDRCVWARHVHSHDCVYGDAELLSRVIWTYDCYSDNPATWGCAVEPLSFLSGWCGSFFSDLMKVSEDVGEVVGLGTCIGNIYGLRLHGSHNQPFFLKNKFQKIWPLCDLKKKKKKVCV